MEKEFKILFGAILTLVFYGVYLLANGGPFFIYPLNGITNALMTIVIIVGLKKYNWRNYLVLIGAMAILAHDPLFLSFFNISIDFKSESFLFFTFIMYVFTNLLCFISLLDRNKIRNSMIFSLFILGNILLFAFGIYAIFFVTLLGLLIVISSKNKDIEFLKVYWMFYIFMILNKVITEILYPAIDF